MTTLKLAGKSHFNRGKASRLANVACGLSIMDRLARQTEIEADSSAATILDMRISPLGIDN
jgi:hypothetical protein